MFEVIKSPSVVFNNGNSSILTAVNYVASRYGISIEEDFVMVVACTFLVFTFDDVIAHTNTQLTVHPELLSLVPVQSIHRAPTGTLLTKAGDGTIVTGAGVTGLVVVPSSAVQPGHLFVETGPWAGQGVRALDQTGFTDTLITADSDGGT